MLMTNRQVDVICCTFLQDRCARAHRLGRSPAAGKSSHLLTRPCCPWWQVPSAFWPHQGRPLQGPMAVITEHEQELCPSRTSGLLKAVAPTPCTHWAPTCSSKLGARGSLPPRVTSAARATHHRYPITQPCRQQSPPYIGKTSD